MLILAKVDTICLVNNNMVNIHKYYFIYARVLFMKNNFTLFHNFIRKKEFRFYRNVSILNTNSLITI